MHSGKWNLAKTFRKYGIRNSDVWGLRGALGTVVQLYTLLSPFHLFCDCVWSLATDLGRHSRLSSVRGDWSVGVWSCGDEKNPWKNRPNTKK